MKMNFRVIGLTLVLLLVAVVITGCSGVKSSKFTQDNVSQILEQVKNSKDLTGEENALLLASMVRYKMQPRLVLEGKTVGEVIEEQRKIKAEYEAQQAEKNAWLKKRKKKKRPLLPNLTTI